MSSRRHILALGALAAFLALGLGQVFQRRLARDLYPPYSSFRADPLGTRALHDSLAALPDLGVRRSLVPPDRLRVRPSQTVLFLGSPRDDWTALPAGDFTAIDTALRAGARVVVCLSAENYASTTAEEREARASKPADKAPPAEPTEPGKTKGKPAHTDTPPPVDAFARWGFKIEIQRDHGDAVIPGAAAGIALPADLRWGSDLVIAPDNAADWGVVCERDGRALLAERRIGSGTLVVATDSFLVSNESLQRSRATPLLTRLLGSHREIVFDESHLGIEEDPGIAALARRYGLMPAFALGAILALLFVWRRAATFVPPPPAAPETALDYRPTSSLSALLRRAVPAGRLLPTCLAEWRRHARPHEIARVETAIAAHKDPVSGYNAAVAALRRRTDKPPAGT